MPTTRLRPQGSESPSRGASRTSAGSCRARRFGTSRSTGGPASLRSRSANVPERPRRDRARGERGRDPAAQRLRAHIDDAVERLEGQRPPPPDEPPPRFRRRCARGRRLAAPADGDRGRCPGRRPDPRGVRALPRFHLDPEGRIRARGRSRTSRRSATSTCATAATSARAPTCTSRTSPRISRPGTSTSPSTSG